MHFARKNKNKSTTSQPIKSSQFPKTRVLFATTVILFAVFLGFTLFFFFGKQEHVQAIEPTESIASGSFIVNMSITPQTANNGLKPYGLIYDLITNYQVPVKWVINPEKSKDGVDFTYNSINYKGGPFIIPKEFITSTISSRISYWQSQGVQGVYTTSQISVPVYKTVTAFAKAMIDTLSSLQLIIINYYTNAGIPATAYSLGSPAELSLCHDLWTNPHGDPTWNTHRYLYDFVTVQKSSIWAQCHSVSMMESCKNPNPPYQQLNFLTSAGLQCWQTGQCGSISQVHTVSSLSPYSCYHSGDPQMQFIGNIELVMQSGSEKWFIPVSDGLWNPATKRGVTTSNGSSPGEGILLAYGPAYGDTSNGMVMYESGHDLTSGGGGAAHPQKVAAQRAYFNFALLTGQERSLIIVAFFPSSMSSCQTSMLSTTVAKGNPPYTFQWTSSLGGSFGNGTDSITSFTAPVVTQDTFTILKIKVTDQCGRVNFAYHRIPLLVSAPLPISLISLEGMLIDNAVKLNWATASEVSNDYFTIYRSSDGLQFEKIGTKDGSGNSSQLINYSFVDEDPLNGISYYRLSQTDFDAHQTICGTIPVNRNSRAPNEKLFVIPNVVRNHFAALYHLSNEQSVTFHIYNSSGNLVYKKTAIGKRGMNSARFDEMDILTSGIHYLSLTYKNGHTETCKIIKE